MKKYYKNSLILSLGTFLCIVCVLFILEILRTTYLAGEGVTIEALPYLALALVAGFSGIPLFYFGLEKLAAQHEAKPPSVEGAEKLSEGQDEIKNEDLLMSIEAEQVTENKILENSEIQAELIEAAEGTEMKNSENVVTNKYFGLALMWTTFTFFFTMAGVVIYFVMGVLLGFIDITTLDSLYSMQQTEGIIFDLLKASFAATIAMLVVIMLRYSAGPIEYELVGLKLKGASGPVVLWVLCLLAVMAGMALP